LVRVAIYDNYKLRASDVEFGLPQPNYTSTTLAHLKEKHPEHEFCMIMGEDNLRTLHKWYNHENLMNNYRFYVYPRVLTTQEEEEVVEIGVRPENGFNVHSSIIMCDDAPVMKVSSSFVRQSIKDGKDVRYLLTEPVHRYIDEMNFYK